MGKYMRKAKTTGEVAVMDLSLGVRTRAKTLALQRQAKLSAPPPSGGGGYLQLRSRRLEKPPPIVHDSRPRHRQSAHSTSNHNNQAKLNPSSRTSSRTTRADSGSRQERGVNKEREVQEEDTAMDDAGANNEEKDLGVEASFGENFLDFESRDRSTRESTPCSLIRDPEAIRTPGSTNRPTRSSESNRRTQNSLHRHIPTAVEMDAFFAGAEEEQQKQFIEKYNFDPVNDKPLPGRYEWKKVDP